MHGARGGAPMGQRNGSFTHGARTKEIDDLRAWVGTIKKMAKEMG